MASLSEFSRLLAIAILNVADDEGFFCADPRLIRGEVFPFEDDYRIITVSIRDLSSVGYLQVREHPEKGLIGMVVNFADHQVINKPKPSKLRDIFNDLPIPDEYGTDTVLIPPGREGNREQGKGREQGIKCGLSAASPPVYPDQFEEFWIAYPKNAQGRKRGKEATLALWRKIPEADRPDLIRATENYARDQTEYIRDPERFLGKNWWRDWIEPAQKQAAKSFGQRALEANW